MGIWYDFRTDLMILKHLATYFAVRKHWGGNTVPGILKKKRCGRYTEHSIDNWYLLPPSSLQGRQRDSGTPYNLSEPVSNCFHCL